ncbi:aminotransferase class V-fold PLP-dependent enzyme [Moraxella catarrhalis]|uniref:Cysteine desulfurase n=1 Tax=Moraxella catarrhalis TaxID=480 RepID=A0A198UI42_MORCA|nr:aminotransferase class V-fold PLP-dependent enzyme [Moraxella catarrhalis]OAU96061.1 Cysteine desulfurase [Moraxella catarrhalis]OAU96589.1 Cysteine desulfurase [Moraxella catarrhalis]OAV00456.1 Cysteine desulfurase [Moraxella catarrhalis]
MLQDRLSDIRRQFAAFNYANENGDLPIYFDGPGGSQVPDCVTQAMMDYLRHGNSNMGSHHHAGVQTMSMNQQARTQAAIWLGADADEIVFGQNATSLMFMISRVVAATWQAGDNVVVSSLDHYSQVSAWQLAAMERGVEVRMIPSNANQDDIDYQAAESMIDERTRLVAVGLASNLIGTIIDIKQLSKTVQSVGAWLSIDAVHAAVHMPIDVKALGADLLFASAYKIGGPHLGLMFARREILQALTPYKVAPATNKPPMSYEQGTQSFESQAGFIAMMRYWASLSGADELTPDSKANSYDLVSAYENQQSQYILDKFGQRPFLKLYGKPSAEGRTPTFAFNIIKDGNIQSGTALSRFLGKQNIALGYGNFYAQALAEALSPTGSVLRMGCLHYTTFDEIDRLFAAIDMGVDQVYR